MHSLATGNTRQHQHTRPITYLNNLKTETGSHFYSRSTATITHLVTISPMIFNQSMPINLWESRGKNKYFARQNEAYCKDVEQVFCILQQNEIIHSIPWLWEHPDLCLVMKMVIMLHNMAIEDELGTEYKDDHKYHQPPQTQANISTHQIWCFFLAIPGSLQHSRTQ